ASTCAIAPQTVIPANFLFQTTDPTTNALTGTANTPVDIAQGASQSFVIALAPTAAFSPTDVDFSFACANASPVTTTIAANATPTFGIFVTGSATVADSPGINRVFVQFTDTNGVLRGETSV